MNNVFTSSNSISSIGKPKDPCIFVKKSCSYCSPLLAPPANNIETGPSPSHSNSNILYFELIFGPDLGRWIVICGLLNKSIKISMNLSLSILSKLANL